LEESILHGLRCNSTTSPVRVKSERRTRLTGRSAVDTSDICVRNAVAVDTRAGHGRKHLIALGVVIIGITVILASILLRGDVATPKS
jgi:hypothetical protein